MSPCHVSLSVYTANTSAAIFRSRAYSIGRAQSVGPIGKSLMMRTASVSRWPGRIGNGSTPAPPPGDQRPVNPMMWWAGSTAAVTRAIAAEASRAVRPGTPATSLPPMLPDTSSANSQRFPVGSTASNAA
jgi:hypothetical protein